MSIISVQANFTASDIGRASAADRALFEAECEDQLDRRFSRELVAALAEHGPCLVGRIITSSGPDLHDQFSQASIHRKSTAVWPLGSGNNDERERFITRYCYA